MAGTRDFGSTITKATLPILLTVLAMAAGCGGGDTVALSTKPGELHKVTGKVVGVGSASLAGAKITFVPKEIGTTARVATGELKADGSFELTTETAGDGVAEGVYKIKIDPPPAKPGVNAKFTAIPPQYQDEDGSGLTATVAAATSSIPPFKLAPASNVGRERD